MENRKSYRFTNVDISFDQLIYKVGSYHYNWHYDIELLWLLSGQIEMSVEGAVYHLFEDDLILINSNFGHATFATKPGSIAMRLHISPYFFISQGLDLSQGQFELNSTKVKFNPEYVKLRKNMAELQLLKVNPEQANPLKHNVAMYNIAKYIVNFFVEDYSNKVSYSYKRENDTMDKVVRFIEKNYTKGITLEQLARKSNYSKSYLSKLFKTELGINFYEYLTRVRLQTAIRMLAATDYSISEISLKNGFSDIKAFNNMFKKHFSITPTAYRKLLNPTLAELDRNYKQEIEENEMAGIIGNFEERVKEQTTLFQNPCERCAHIAVEEKYTELINQLKKILP